MSISQPINTRASTIYIWDNVLYIIFKKDVEVELQDINEIIAKRNEILKQDKINVLVDIRELWQANKAARERSASDDMISRAHAIAILSNSLPTRLLANFYMKFVKEKVPTKMFNEKSEALDWLNHQ